MDLPGLISVANEEQTEADVKIIQDMVDSYLTNLRTIILAVVQANNDIANKGIIQKSRRFGPAGERTVGLKEQRNESLGWQSKTNIPNPHLGKKRLYVQIV